MHRSKISDYVLHIEGKIEVPRDVRNSKETIDMTSSGKNDLNIRTNASPKSQIKSHLYEILNVLV